MINGDVTTGIMGRKRVLVSRLLKRRWDKIAEYYPFFIPPIVRKYAAQVSKITGVEEKKVLKSEPVKKYWERWDKVRWP